MIRHVVLLNWNDKANDAAVQAVTDGLAALPGQIPEIRSYTVGRDLGLSEAAATVVVSGDFDNVDDYQVYANHPEHVRVVTEHIRPHATVLTRAQIEI